MKFKKISLLLFYNLTYCHDKIEQHHNSAPSKDQAESLVIKKNNFIEIESYADLQTIQQNRPCFQRELSQIIDIQKYQIELELPQYETDLFSHSCMSPHEYKNWNKSAKIQIDQAKKIRGPW